MQRLIVLAAVLILACGQEDGRNVVNEESPTTKQPSEATQTESQPIDPASEEADPPQVPPGSEETLAGPHPLSESDLIAIRERLIANCVVETTQDMEQGRETHVLQDASHRLELVAQVDNQTCLFTNFLEIFRLDENGAWESVSRTVLTLDEYMELLGRMN